MVRTLRIARQTLGPGRPVFVIAEVGSNHNRSLATAKRLIDVAARAGADAVKFQTFRGNNLYSKFTPAPPPGTPFYEFFRGKTVPAAFRQWELPFAWHRLLAAYAKQRGLVFLSTPFDLGAVALLAELRVPAYKIASYEINNLPLVRAVAQQGRPVILSTAGADLGRVRTAVRTCRAAGNRQLVILHCVAEYPAPVAHMNLQAIGTLREEFGTPVGLSDHSRGSLAAIGAVALGAIVFEKHITLSHKLPGPDQSHATEPAAFRRYVSDIRDACASLGTGVKRATAAEKADAAGNSLVAAVPIPRGVRITRRMLTVKRPSRGIDPSYEKRVVGKVARRDIPQDMWIRWSDLR